MRNAVLASQASQASAFCKDAGAHTSIVWFSPRLVGTGLLVPQRVFTSVVGSDGSNVEPVGMDVANETELLLSSSPSEAPTPVLD